MRTAGIIRTMRSFASDEKLCRTPHGEIRPANKRVAQRFGAQEESRSYRRYEGRAGRGCWARGDIDASRKLPANNGFEAGQRESVVHRCRAGKKGVRVGWKACIVVCEEIGQNDAKYSVSRETLSDFGQEPHRIGDEIDRVRDMDDVISRAHVHLLDLAVPHANAYLLVHVRYRGVGIDPFRVPTMVREHLDGFSETASDVEKMPSAAWGERRENPKRARRKRAETAAAARPNIVQLGVRETGRDFVLQPDSFQHVQIRLIRRISVAAAAAQSPFMRSLVAFLAAPALDFRIDRGGNGPVVDTVANWAMHC
jgi:hypothetical protein